MKTTMYQLIENATGREVGFIIGKTPDNELVIDTGSRTRRLKITARMESKYRVEKVTFTVEVSK